MKIRRQAEEMAKPNKDARRLLRWWKCSDCTNLFAALPFIDESTDGRCPVCCPYCGVIFVGHTEIPR